MFGTPTTDPLAAVESQLGELCGQLNVVTGQITERIAAVAESGAWAATGCKTLKQWVAVVCGVSGQRASALVDIATRRDELPATIERFDAGLLSEDQVTVIARRAPEDISAETEAHYAGFAQLATVTQLRTAMRLASVPQPEPAGDGGEPEEKPPSVSFGYDDLGRWRCTIDAPAAAAAPVDVALKASSDALFQQWKRDRDAAEAADGGASDGPPPPTRFDALLRMAELSTSREAELRPHFARTRTIIHVDADRDIANLHLGPALSAADRALLTCDSTWEVWLERNGVPIGVGRTSRRIPDRLRIHVEERHGGRCARPGCTATTGLHLHHITYWDDGGPTESWNLVPACNHCHHEVHAGRLSVEGNADEPDGLVWRNHRGLEITGASAARPPTKAPPPATYVHPLGERCQWKWYTPPAWN